jgi:hypothetical protein
MKHTRLDGHVRPKRSRRSLAYPPTVGRSSLPSAASTPPTTSSAPFPVTSSGRSRRCQSMLHFGVTWVPSPPVPRKRHQTPTAGVCVDQAGPRTVAWSPAHASGAVLLPGNLLTDAATPIAGIHPQRRESVQTMFNQDSNLGGRGPARHLILLVAVSQSWTARPPGSPLASSRSSAGSARASPRAPTHVHGAPL